MCFFNKNLSAMLTLWAIHKTGRRPDLAHGWWFANSSYTTEKLRLVKTWEDNRVNMGSAKNRVF